MEKNRFLRKSVNEIVPKLYRIYNFMSPQQHRKTIKES